MNTITFTPAAVEKLKQLLVDETPNTSLRVFVRGGGCAGFQYGFTFDTVVNEDDFVSTQDGVGILVDSASAQYLTMATVDYVDSITGSMFQINNPNVISTCGCGSSFSA